MVLFTQLGSLVPLWVKNEGDIKSMIKLSESMIHVDRHPSKHTVS